MIVSLKGKLDLERKQKDSLSDQLEDPKNRNGWRELDGHDLDEEQLVAQINVQFNRFSPFRRELEDVTNHDHNYEKNYYPAPYALRTTAEPRLISYISEENMGLPKPFGSMAPFKPSNCAGGTTMRHIRTPAMKQVS